MDQLGSILLSSDFLMTKTSEQDSNLRWLTDVLSYPMKQASDGRMTVASGYFNDRWGFSRERFFELSGINLNPIDTHFDYEVDALTQGSLDYLRGFVSPDALVVGYELSTKTRSVLDKIGVTYLDIWLGPIRFMDDITFVLRSNDHERNKRISNYALNPDVIRAQAAITKVQTYRGFAKANHVFEEGSAVFAGQMLTDKALMRNGSMLTLLDFRDEFAQEVRNHSRVYYARHPFLKKGDEEILEFALSFRNVELTDAPSYHALCSDDVRKVFGITSSLVAEARYFDKETRFFSEPQIPTVGENSYHPVMHEILFPYFWDMMLSGEVKSGSDNLSFASPKDKLRDALSFYWGYRKIDKIEYIRAVAGRRPK